MNINNHFYISFKSLFVSAVFSAFKIDIFWKGGRELPGMIDLSRLVFSVNTSPTRFDGVALVIWFT